MRCWSGNWRIPTRSPTRHSSSTCCLRHISARYVDREPRSVQCYKFPSIIFIITIIIIIEVCSFSQMRVRLSDLERLESFADVCQQDNHLDLVFAIRRLQTESAFHFVHSLRPYAFKSYMLDPQQLTHRKLKLANRIAGHRNLLQSTDLFRVCREVFVSLYRFYGRTITGR